MPLSYGNLVNFTGTPVTSLLYSGEWRDGATGLDYLRDRWAEPSNGRFAQLDRLNGSLYEPRSFNGYVYTAGNPVGNIDPLGTSYILDFTIQNAIRGAIAGIVLGTINGVWSYAKGATALQSIWNGVKTAGITWGAFVSPLLAWSLLPVGATTIGLDVYSSNITWEDTPELVSYLAAGIVLHLLFKNGAYNAFEVKTFLKAKIPEAVNNLRNGTSTNAARNAKWNRAVAAGDRAAQGTLIHSELADLMRAQRMSNMKIEASYNEAGGPARYGDLNSVRLDYEVTVGGRTIRVYDLKPTDVIRGEWLLSVANRLQLSPADIRSITYGQYLP